MDCNFLFLQSLNARKVVKCAKVSEGDNPADVCSKNLNAEFMTKHVSAVDGRWGEGRPALCPKTSWRSGFDAKQLSDGEFSRAVVYLEGRTSA